MNLSSLACYLRQGWEAVFFAAIWAFLSFQVVFLVYDHKEPGELNSLVTQYIALNSFTLYTYGPFFASVTFTLLILSSIKGPDSPFSRNVLDALGIYYVLRMIIQLIGLNILVFDSESSRLVLLTQLIFYLPYVLFIWEWIYWRLDKTGRSHGRPLFKLDHEADRPRVIDYFVASFSTSFPLQSATSKEHQRAQEFSSLFMAS